MQGNVYLDGQQQLDPSPYQQIENPPFVDGPIPDQYAQQGYIPAKNFNEEYATDLNKLK